MDEVRGFENMIAAAVDWYTGSDNDKLLIQCPTGRIFLMSKTSIDGRNWVLTCQWTVPGPAPELDEKSMRLFATEMLERAGAIFDQTQSFAFKNDDERDRSVRAILGGGAG